MTHRSLCFNGFFAPRVASTDTGRFLCSTLLDVSRETGGFPAPERSSTMPLFHEYEGAYKVYRLLIDKPSARH